MRISDWSSDVCSSDLHTGGGEEDRAVDLRAAHPFDIVSEAVVLGKDIAVAIGKEQVEQRTERPPDQTHIRFPYPVEGLDQIEIAPRGQAEARVELKRPVVDDARLEFEQRQDENGRAPGRERGWQYG